MICLLYGFQLELVRGSQETGERCSENRFDYEMGVSAQQRKAFRLRRGTSLAWNGVVESSVVPVSGPSLMLVVVETGLYKRPDVMSMIRRNIREGKGVGHGRHRSDRLRSIGVILYMFGLSYRAVAQFLPLLDCRGSKSSIERDVAEAGHKARDYHESAPPMRVRVLGVDGTGAAMAGRNTGVLFFVDIERQRLICVESVSEQDTRAVRRHVSRVLREVGAEELRTDEHSVYKGSAGSRRHRICLTHWRKSKGKRARQLYDQAVAEERCLEAMSMKQLQELLRMEPRPPTVPEALTRLVRRYINGRKGLLWKINQLLQHVERTWGQVSDDPRDPTNNSTERIIGLTLKIRAKTMRGFKAEAKLLAHPYLATFLRGNEGLCDLRQIV